MIRTASPHDYLKFELPGGGAAEISVAFALAAERLARYACFEREDLRLVCVRDEHDAEAYDATVGEFLVVNQLNPWAALVALADKLP